MAGARAGDLRSVCMSARPPVSPRRAAWLAALAATVTLAWGVPAAVRWQAERPLPPPPTTAGLAARALAALPAGLNDAATAEALARWVVAHTTNDPQRTVPGEALPLRGLCGTRSALFVALARAAGLRAERVNLYDFPYPGSGHSCAQVLWDGAWHFFDVTYAGVFTRGERILSLDDIRSDPERALAGLVVFEGGLDCDADGRAVDNRQRMRAVWTADAIRGLGATGVPDSSEVRPLVVRWDLGRHARTLAADDPAALDRAGASAGITQQLGGLLGAGPQRFATRIEVAGVPPGRTLRLRLSFLRASRAGMRLAAEAERASIERGAELTTTTAMTAPGRHAWEIVLRPTGPRFTLALDPLPAKERLDLVGVTWTAMP